MRNSCRTILWLGESRTLRRRGDKTAKLRREIADV